jgi:hypothetical protein
MPTRLRSTLAGLTALVLLTAIGGVFWLQDWRYSLPTPRPEGWRAVAVGTRVALPSEVEALRQARPGAPVLLHFFNPDCPCSRFNLDHVRQLIQAHGGEAIFVAVLRDGPAGTLKRKFEALELGIPAVLDAGLSDALGVYSTPQAVVLDGAGRLYYAGNYNLTRYCRDRETEFARLALEGVRAGAPPPSFESAATVAYGCPLPPRTRRQAAGSL